MRQIRELIWHCTATPEGREHTAKDIDDWHKARGWKGIGYHKVVHLDGRVSEGRPESQVGAHVENHNAGTIGYVYVGGTARESVKIPKDTRTAAQKRTMERLTREAIERYGITKVSGHSDYANKACPCFNARAEYAHLLRKPQTADAMPERDPATDMGELKSSRTVAGGSLAAVSTVGSAVSEAAQTIEPVSEISRIAKYAFLALILLGVAITIYARWDDAGRPLPWKRGRA